MSEHFLNRADVVTVLKQMRRKRMTKRVRAGIFGDPGLLRIISLNGFCRLAVKLNIDLFSEKSL
jgi:hypothetical protein